MNAISLVVDAGHTRVKLAKCVQENEFQLPEARQSLAAIYGTPVDWATVESWFEAAPPDAVIVTGTNALRARELVDVWPSSLPAPTLLTDKRRIPLRVEVDFPEKVGMDRLLNSVAANVLRQPDQPVIIVDTGTAITVDVVDRAGTFQGGAILPGILLGAKSLHEETTTLPHVDVWELLKREPAVLGKNTEAAIASGLYWGHLGAVKELVQRYGDVLTTDQTQPLLLLTGGASVILAPYLAQARQVPDLSLQGLAIVAHHLKNSSSEKS
ncbi:type III pantothenate kinase [Planctomicrobium sp. SH661]|uniref:type III pantothenate kinase n=1 Tax=Planctomicrobium sp. SH661 TaxID=3448124 RepID=UPI003F5ADF7C